MRARGCGPRVVEGARRSGGEGSQTPREVAFGLTAHTSSKSNTAASSPTHISDSCQQTSFVLAGLDTPQKAAYKMASGYEFKSHFGAILLKNNLYSE